MDGTRRDETRREDVRYINDGVGLQWGCANSKLEAHVGGVWEVKSAAAWASRLSGGEIVGHSEETISISKYCF
jgi:hypothetical protein